MTVLEVERLSKAFGGVQAVSDVSFGLEAGELLALIGPNGAGKTTCFDCINGQLTPDAGRVRLDGRELADRSPRAIWRLGVGRTFQITRTFGSLTVRQNVQAALISHHGRSRRLWQRADDMFRETAEALLGRIGMDEQADRAAAILAYGDLKRVELAIALANDPKLLLMDEPTAGMAPRERLQLMELIRGIVRERQLAVLFTEHDMDVVFNNADRIMVMNRGELIATGSPETVRDDPLVQETYLGTGRLAERRPEHDHARGR